MKSARLLLAGGVAMPIIYFANLIVAEIRTPEVDPWSQLPSDLGVAGLAWAGVFNAGLIATGLAAAAGAIGLFLGLRQIGANIFLSAFAGGAMFVAGIVMAMAGLFPLPNPLHYGFNLLPVGMLTPLFAALALGVAKDAGRQRAIIFAGFVAIIAIVIASESIKGLVTRETVGLWSRALGFIAFSTIAYACFSVMRRVR
jgi:hypothetical membrane protein